MPRTLEAGTCISSAVRSTSTRHSPSPGTALSVRAASQAAVLSVYRVHEKRVSTTGKGKRAQDTHPTCTCKENTSKWMDGNGGEEVSSVSVPILAEMSRPGPRQTFFRPPLDGSPLKVGNKSGARRVPPVFSMTLQSGRHGSLAGCNWPARAGGLIEIEN